MNLFSDLGQLGSSLYQATNQPQPETLAQLLWKALTAEGGGLGMNKQQKLNQLLAIPADQRTAGQNSQIAKLQSQSASRPAFLDKFLQVEQQFQPQFDKMMMDRLQQLAPQLANLQTSLYAQNAPLITQAAVAAEKAGSPDFFGLQQNVTQQANQNLGQGLNPQQLQFFRNQLMASQAQRGLQDSPLGSEAEAMALTQLNLAQQQQNYQNALAAQANYKLPPLPGYPSIGAQNVQGLVPQQPIFGTPSFNTILGGQQNAANQQLASSLYNNQLVGNAIQYGTQTVGDIAALAAGGMGGGMGGAMGGMGGLMGMFGGGGSGMGGMTSSMPSMFGAGQGGTGWGFGLG